MPSGLLALLDDVATIAKLAASSLDDAAGAAGKAGTKAAGVLIDDTAVTPRYVTGLSPERELPIIGKIAWGSLRNKIAILLPVALLLTAFAPFLVTPLLMCGGAYLAFEATEKILEKLLHEHEHEEQLVDAMGDPAELEKMQVKGAIRTDFILSAEIMAIALASLEHLTFVTTAIALVVVAIAITIGVYGVVALIVKLDDIGLHMAERRNRTTRGLSAMRWCAAVPMLLSGLSAIGTAAMLWVGGGILVHGLEETKILAPHPAHHPRRFSHRAGEASGILSGIVSWLVNGARRRHRRHGHRRDHRRGRPPLHQAPGRADRRLIEVKPAVAARGSRGTGRARHRSSPSPPADQHVVVAAIVDRVAFAFEHAERILEDRRAGLAARPGRRSEPILVAGRKADRGRLLPGLQHVYREVRRLDQAGGARRALGKADQQQRRIERNRGEAVDRQSGRLARRVEAGDDGHARREAAERIAQRSRVMPAAIFAPGRQLGHARAL